MVRYVIDPARSRLSIDGRSSLHDIHTEAGGLEGWLEMDVSADAITSTRACGHVELAVDKLSSGKALEDHELRRRIDTGRYPTISGEIESMTVVDDGGAHGRHHLVGGALTFRGVTRRYEDRVVIDVANESTVTITGQSVFDIRDFGMEPPRLLMLKVDPEVRVRIDVVAERQPARRQSATQQGA